MASVNSCSIFSYSLNTFICTIYGGNDLVVVVFSVLYVGNDLSEQTRSTSKDFEVAFVLKAMLAAITLVLRNDRTINGNGSISASIKGKTKTRRIQDQVYLQHFYLNYLTNSMVHYGTSTSRY